MMIESKSAHARVVFWLFLVGGSTAIGGCSEPGDGEVLVTVYGEEFIELGIDSDTMDDGWAVEFERVQVGLEDVVVGDIAVVSSSTIDIAAPSGGSGYLIGSAAASEGAYRSSSFMLREVSVSGSATRDGITKTFDWQFDVATHYSECETITEVREGQTATFQVTIHIDHLFYDSLVSQEPGLYFQPLADADLDGDGVITRAELQDTDIGGYDPGSSGGIDDLWSWLLASSRTLGHVDGEGHCRAQMQ